MHLQPLDTNRWDERRVPLQRFLQVNRPDILCVQELTPQACGLIDAALPDHRRVEDPFPGFTEEGTIYWNTEIFDLVEYGAEDIGIIEEKRRLSWVRLRTTSGATVVVATAHFTWLWEAGASGEWITVRVAQAKAAVMALEGVTQPVPSP
jgi:endonuclease/exonuclease/phosphatase family metal-dependent hydrolase